MYHGTTYKRVQTLQPARRRAGVPATTSDLILHIIADKPNDTPSAVWRTSQGEEAGGFVVAPVPRFPAGRGAIS